jgi:radical SAM superfamily enzyme YgiQ (UPF0313 family)
MTSIGLVSLRSPFLDDSKIYPPLANLYLKAFVNHHNPQHCVTIVDDDYNLNTLEQFDNFDMVGISVMTPQRDEMRKLVFALKQKQPKKKIIVGGPHVRHYQRDVENDTAIDFLVAKDGEWSLLKVLNGFNMGRIFHDVMDKKDIAEAPRPDRTSDNAIAVLNKYKYELAGRQATTMMTSRGCPERCTFCEDAMTAVKWSSLEHLTQEMDDIKRLGFGGVYIFDDLFAIALPKVEPIARELKRRDLVYRCNAQARYFTKWGDRMAKLLADTGCVEVAFGAETGSQKILDNIQKRTTVEQNYETVRLAKQAGLNIKAFILLGLPGEDLTTLRETERFVAESGIDDFQCAVYMPFKGTQIRDAIDRGETIGLTIEGKGLDGDVTGAYGVKGGETAYEVRTTVLSANDLQAFRTYLVDKYKPKSHKVKWQEDKFFEQGGASC